MKKDIRRSTLHWILATFLIIAVLSGFFILSEKILADRTVLQSVQKTETLGAPVSQNSSWDCETQPITPTENRNITIYHSNGKTYSFIFPYFSQKDSRYADTPYGYYDKNETDKSNIGRSGCGITAAAMVLRYFGKCADPLIIANFSLSYNFRPSGKGTSSKIFPALATRYGLKNDNVGMSSSQEAKWDFIYYWIKAGQPVIASLKGGQFGTQGHYVVLNGINSKNQVIISDPNGKKNITNATFNEIKSHVQHAHVFYK